MCQASFTYGDSSFQGTDCCSTSTSGRLLASTDQSARIEVTANQFVRCAFSDERLQLHCTADWQNQFFVVLVESRLLFATLLTDRVPRH